MVFAQRPVQSVEQCNALPQQLVIVVDRGPQALDDEADGWGVRRPIAFILQIEVVDDLGEALDGAVADAKT